jgi:Uma2 family endonuclease
MGAEETMSTATVPMTAEDLLAMPDDGIERWIYKGELREGGMTVRNLWHSETLALLTSALWDWIRTQPRPRGTVAGGEAGVRLCMDPEITVGVDVAYLGPKLANADPGASTIVEGVPTLAVEILSPSDKHEDVEEKINVYLEAGVPQVWTVNTIRRTVTVYRPGQKPVMYNDAQDLPGDPELPGFLVPVRGLFEDIAP